MGSGAAIGGLVLHATSVSALGWIGGLCEVVALGVLFLSTQLQSKRAAGSQQESNISDDELVESRKVVPHVALTKAL